MYKKEADLKPKPSAQGTSFLVSTTKEQTLSTWEEMTMFHSSRLKQINRGSAPLHIRSCREDWDAPLGSGGSKSMLNFSQAGRRDSLFQKTFTLPEGNEMHRTAQPVMRQRQTHVPSAPSCIWTLTGESYWIPQWGPVSCVPWMTIPDGHQVALCK